MATTPISDPDGLQGIETTIEHETSDILTLFNHASLQMQGNLPIQDDVLHISWST